MTELWRKLLYLFRRRQREQELDDELRFHAEMSGAGQFGNVLRHKEDSREAWGFGPFDRFGQDLRYGVRILRKSPGFTLVAVLSLALGIGANTAVFSLIDAILLRPLPILHPQELVTLSRSNLRSSGMTSFPYPFYKELREQNILADLVCMSGMEPSISLNGAAARITGEMVSGNYYQALGIHPYAGRLLQPDDETAPGANPVAVLSYGFWQRQFAGDRSIIGKTIRLNTTPVTVIGVSPPGYTSLQFGWAPDIRVPMTMQADMLATNSWLSMRGDYWLKIVGRLKPGIAKGQAEAALTTFMYNYLRQNAIGRKQSDYDRRVLESMRMFLPSAGDSRARPLRRPRSFTYS